MLEALRSGTKETKGRKEGERGKGKKENGRDIASHEYKKSQS
jgi:hypothetical protein